MKIRKELPQFEKAKTLIVATGQQSAKFYLAQDGEIEELEMHITSNPRYTDREGFFAEKRGTDLGSGSVYESKKLYVENKFLHWLRKEIKFLQDRHHFTEIYFFSPDFRTKDLLAELKEFQNLIRLSLDGNFVDEHPFVLLERIKAGLEEEGNQEKL